MGRSMDSFILSSRIGGQSVVGEYTSIHSYEVNTSSAEAISCKVLGSPAASYQWRDVHQTGRENLGTHDSFLIWPPQRLAVKVRLWW